MVLNVMCYFLRHGVDGVIYIFVFNTFILLIINFNAVISNVVDVRQINSVL